jgi:cytochrome oxidase Cu insertion factor (SCO1/SenC/PrrC family)
MAQRRSCLRLGAVLAVAAWLATSAGLAADKSERSAAQLMDVVMWDREPVGGPFRLTDATGKLRRDTDFRGKIMLVYFGFTFCPDICPTDLQQIGAAMDKLGPAANDVVPIFITLDPQRDTKKLLAQYVPAFHPSIVGLTGSDEAIRQAAQAYKVYYKKVAVSGAMRYTIDHSSFIYLMGRDGKYIGFMPPSTTAERMVEMIQPYLVVKSR